TPQRLDAPFSYETYAGKKFTHPLSPALVHLFNHQTHHRGQLTTLLSQLGIDPGVTDAMAFYREQALDEGSRNQADFRERAGACVGIHAAAGRERRAAS